MSLYSLIFLFFFFFNDTATTEIYTLSLHDALPICWLMSSGSEPAARAATGHWIVFSSGALSRCKPFAARKRSEEHTSELQSLTNLVCRLLLEKKKNKSKSQ